MWVRIQASPSIAMGVSTAPLLRRRLYTRSMFVRAWPRRSWIPTWCLHNIGFKAPVQRTAVGEPRGFIRPERYRESAAGPKSGDQLAGIAARAQPAGRSRTHPELRGTNHDGGYQRQHAARSVAIARKVLKKCGLPEIGAVLAGPRRRGNEYLLRVKLRIGSALRAGWIVSELPDKRRRDANYAETPTP